MNGVRGGALVGAVAGLLLLLVTVRVVPQPWPPYVAGAGLFGFLWVVWLVLRVPGDPDAYRPEARQLQAFWVAVGLEVVAAAAGVALAVRVLGQPQLALSWVAILLGGHWLASRLVFQDDLFLWLGWFTTTLGVLGLLVTLTEAGPPESATVVSGPVLGVVLLGTVGVDAQRRRGRLSRPRASRRPRGRST